MNYYSFHIGDYRRDTAHLSLLEHGVYRQLLDWIYLDEKPIPKETDVVFRRLCARTDEEKGAVIIVLEELFELTENGYIQTRCMGEIATYQGQAARARENGKLGGRPPKTTVVIDGLSEKTKTKANQEPRTTNHYPLTTTHSKSKPLSEYSDEFERFWIAYPKKIGKGGAYSSWKKQRPEIESVLLAVTIQSKSDQWKKENGQFIPNPQTWINQRRWDDGSGTTEKSGYDPHEFMRRIGAIPS